MPRVAGRAIEQRRRGVSIGESLAEARRQAGLSINQVSQRTRVREPIIRGIERDDYSACGGDFYARGHIRSIARAVGADPEPLIREYDATVRSEQQVTAADLFRPATPIKVREPRRRPWTVALGLALVVVIAVAAYQVISGTRHAPAANPTACGTSLSQSYVDAGAAKSWNYGYAVVMQVGNPGGISLTVDGENPLRPGTGNPITLSLGLNGKISS